MSTRDALLRHLKVSGPSTVRELARALAISPNAVRHHLTRLRGEGFVHEDQRREGVGRPAKLVALTRAAEGEFPKRYPDLLEAVLDRAEARSMLHELLSDVADTLAARVRPELDRLPPAERLQGLMDRLDYGEMLGQLRYTPGGWEFRAYNCVYRATGERFEGVCDLLPEVVKRAAGTDAERVHCQRDGHRTCTFAGSFLPPR